MKKNKDEKWLDEIISRAVDFGKIEFDAHKWNEKYLSSESHEASRSNVRIKSHKNFWRFIMESKVTRYSAAAVITLATVLILVNPFGNSQYGGVVLADVQQKVAGIDTMIIRGTKTFKHPGEDGEIFEFDGIKCHFDLIKYMSKETGFVEEGYADGNLFYRITFNLPKKQTLIIFPPYKKYLTFPSMESVATIIEKFTMPDGVINLLLEGEYKKLGKDKIDGVEVEGFQFQNAGIENIKNIFPKLVFDIQDYTGKIWIGIEDQLPIRIEGDMSIGKSFMSMFHELNLQEVNVLDKYNIELDEDIFDVEPPEGYTQVTLNDILQMIPTEAKTGLVSLGVIPIAFILWRKHRKKSKNNINEYLSL